MGRIVRVLFLAVLAVGALSAQGYFPPGVPDKTPQGELQAALYSRHLKALREPSLWELSMQDPKAEVYRFLWLRKSRHPIAVRLVVRAGGSGWIHSRMTTGDGGYETGKIMQYGVSWLRKARTEEFLTALQRADFRKLPTLTDPNDSAAPGAAIHGDSEWVIEGVKDGQYHMVDRRSPDPADPVRVLGTMALKLARFRIPAGQLY